MSISDELRRGQVWWIGGADAARAAPRRRVVRVVAPAPPPPDDDVERRAPRRGWRRAHAALSRRHLRQPSRRGVRAFGAVLTGPINYVWLGGLQRAVQFVAPAGGAAAVASKVAAQSTVMQPFIYLPTFFGVEAAVRGRAACRARARARALLADAAEAVGVLDAGGDLRLRAAADAPAGGLLRRVLVRVERGAELRVELRRRGARERDNVLNMKSSSRSLVLRASQHMSREPI